MIDPVELHGGEVANDAEIANGHPAGVARVRIGGLLKKIESRPTRERRGGPKAIAEVDQARGPTQRDRGLQLRQDGQTRIRNVRGGSRRE